MVVVVVVVLAVGFGFVVGHVVDDDDGALT